MSVKFTALDWQSSGAGERIVASMTFDNFEQSCRFIEAITDFVLKERAKESLPHPAGGNTGGPHGQEDETDDEENGRQEGRQEKADAVRQEDEGEEVVNPPSS